MLERIFERDAELIGHHRHDLIDAEDRHAERAADVANRRPSGQRAERADLSDVRLAVFVLHVLNDFAAAILAEVDVDIGRFAAVFIQEPLEQQAVVQRAHVADLQRVANERADARTAGRAGNLLLDRVAHEVPHDEEVIAEAELLDDVQLALEPLPHFVAELARLRIVVLPTPRIVCIPLAQARFAQLAQIRGWSSSHPAA